MKEKRNVHLKVQELCDCHATSDPLKEMSVVKNDEDKTQRDIAEAANVTEVTIRNRYKGLKDSLDV